MFTPDIELCFPNGVLRSLLAKYDTRLTFQTVVSNLDIDHLVSDGLLDYENADCHFLHLVAACGRFGGAGVGSLIPKSMSSDRFSSHMIAVMGTDTNSSPFLKTPTSLAMYVEETFYIWRQLLRSSDVSIPQFIKDELEKEPLLAKKWEIETLTVLFSLDIRPRESKIPCSCTKCLGAAFMVQCSWLERLERLKKRTGPDWEAYRRFEDKKQATNEDGIQIPTLFSAATCHGDEKERLEAMSPSPPAIPTEDDFMCVWCWYEK